MITMPGLASGHLLLYPLRIYSVVIRSKAELVTNSFPIITLKVFFLMWTCSVGEKVYWKGMFKI